MSWNILFFETSRRERPVQEFIKSLNSTSKAKVARSIDLLEDIGPFLCMPHCKKITDDVFELRIRGSEEVRILYVIKQKNIYLLHAFKKKSQKIPAREIHLAEFRAKLLTNI